MTIDPASLNYYRALARDLSAASRRGGRRHAARALCRILRGILRIRAERTFADIARDRVSRLR
jgi:hypothetical protein